ncbi:unnamed protein product [Phaedon cochleariae]|uniref:Uncharacterized protein n=1 Tax=Phaedon cochleariae TaxID=80249 RepID=A0A9N9SCD7_PHACE|nr:unnamed protein product [Phaedon cochleariae]
MAVFRNYYNRKSHWTITLSCLYLLCSTISCIIGSTTERKRHHHMKLGGYISQLEKSRSILGCPNCLYENQYTKERSESDQLRLEAIKKQILQKLGLRHKPNVTQSLPRDIVWQTLERADEDSDFLLNRYEDFSTTSDRSSAEETVDVDDFYGRTSEIISFAEEDLGCSSSSTKRTATNLYLLHTNPQCN